MTSETQAIVEAMERFLANTENEFLMLFKNLNGNQMDIECGTHIKIPTGAGYVSYYKSAENFSIVLYLRDNLMFEKNDEKSNPVIKQEL